MQSVPPWRPPPRQSKPSEDVLAEVHTRTRGRPTGRSRELIVIALAAALVLVVAGVVVTFSVGPEAAIAHFRLNDERICTGVPGGNIIVTFDLDNAGGPGFVRIYYMDDNATVDIKDYRVGLWASTPVSETLYVFGCAPQYIKAEVIAEWAG